MENEEKQRLRESRLVERRAADARRQAILESRQAERLKRLQARQAEANERKSAARRTRSVAARPVAPLTDLPRVLLIGDTISIGYTFRVRRLLHGKASVERIPRSSDATPLGLAHIAVWLSSRHWNVIHFNFGLEDAREVSPGVFRTSRDQYVANLRLLVAEMKSTGARLIFATTTPIHHAGAGLPGQVFDDIATRNELARRVMEANCVAIDDLHAAALPRLAEIASPDDGYFLSEGYGLLARAVATSIEKELAKLAVRQALNR